MPSFSVNELNAALNSRGGIAKANRFLIELPTRVGTGNGITYFSTAPSRREDFTVLCQRANMPGKQILSLDRLVGPTNQKVAYTYGSNDVSLSFILTNDFFIKKYFEEWHQLIMVNDDADPIHYPRYKNEYAAPVTIYQLNKKGEKVYGVRLYDAYPTTVNPIEYSNEGEGVIDLSVDLSYKRWSPYKPGELE